MPTQSPTFFTYLSINCSILWRPTLSQLFICRLEKHRDEFPASSVDDVLRIIQSDHHNAYFLTGNFTSSIYAENCIFEDPTIKFRGKNYRLLPTATCMLLFLLCLAWPFFSSSACPSSTTQVTHIAVTGKKKHERKENITLKMYNQLKL
eukprot:XP_014627813.1 uncharacterized protein LOC100820537 [Glycine max]